ncbi:MAG: nucleotidyl transferase AbiEii/AbiGii toxin family protein [Lachnospiraceae bacterium]|nr:nucleotidyl transferase AbiEii/AbiGii toxin family protein [Lachnospiraceae bacterium]
MIHTSKQLKDKVRNISKGDNDVAKMLIRSFIMERFLERVSLSPYRNNFILKGGMLVASIIGVDLRATMDIDTTVKSLPLSEEDARRIVVEICNVQVEDGISFEITSVNNIMEDFEYPGVRIILAATLERLRQTIKIDISTDDVLTPAAVVYEYKLMFENRTIFLLSYNMETLLAEKMQTILARGIANTRMRDFYDVYEIMKQKNKNIDKKLLREAFEATCHKRETEFHAEKMDGVLHAMEKDPGLADMWERFRISNYFVGDLQWEEVLTYDIAVIKAHFY